MTSTITIAPPNSLIAIAEARTRACPERFEPGQGIASTASCIAVGCYPEQDGETSITLGPAPKANNHPAFAGFLDTPNHRVAVWTIEWKKLLEAKVPTSRTKIRIWTNHPTDPTEVFIGIGE
jgi:hypothetical protein